MSLACLTLDICRSRIGVDSLESIKKPHGVGRFYWCKIVDSIQTVATAQETDYKLNALAKEFNLSAERV